MHNIGVVVLFSIVAVCLAAENPFAKQKPGKYDNVDIDKILNNQRVLNNYIKCLMGEGPCTPEGRELKKTLPDALENGCNKCNENQKEQTEKVIKHLINKRAKDWERLSKKYDPQGIYKQKYQHLLDQSA